jgi:hypothetical protein
VEEWNDVTEVAGSEMGLTTFHNSSIPFLPSVANPVLAA